MFESVDVIRITVVANKCRFVQDAVIEPMITCRRATREDVELFKTIRLRALKDSPDAYGSTYEAAVKRDHASWEEQLWSTVEGVDRNTQFAFQDGECIGIAALYREPSASTGDIIMMWVAPDFRGSRAATYLVQALLRWARESEFHSVALNVTDSNVRAIKFYEKQGFCATGDKVEVDMQRNLRGIRMELMLDDG